MTLRQWYWYTPIPQTGRVIASLKGILTHSSESADMSTSHGSGPNSTSWTSTPFYTQQIQHSGLNKQQCINSGGQSSPAVSPPTVLIAQHQLHALCFGSFFVNAPFTHSFCLGRHRPCLIPCSLCSQTVVKERAHSFSNIFRATSHKLA